MLSLKLLVVEDDTASPRLKVPRSLEAKVRPVGDSQKAAILVNLNFAGEVRSVVGTAAALIDGLSRVWAKGTRPIDGERCASRSVGLIAIGFGGWLGGEMVYVKGMAVEVVEKLARKVEKTSQRRVA